MCYKSVKSQDLQNFAVLLKLFIFLKLRENIE